MNAENQQYLDLIVEDLAKLKSEHTKGPAAFLKFVNENYSPADKKIELTEEMLTDGNLKRTMTIKFSKVFHPDKQVNEEKKIQVLRAEIMKMINQFVEMFK